MQQQASKEECTYREKNAVGEGQGKKEKHTAGQLSLNSQKEERKGVFGEEEKRIEEGQKKKEEIWELLAAAHRGDKGARDQMVQRNMGLVWSIAHRFSNRGYELEELFQVGSIGLMKAIDKFDLSYGVKFSTYAVPMITGEIKRFLRDDGMIKVSRSLKENGAKVKQAREKLQRSLGREPTLQEISDETGFPREEIVMALEANGEVESLSKTYAPGDGKETCLADRLPQEKDSHEALLNHMLLEQLMAGLGEMERRLIELRYFGEKTQMQVAGELGISQVQVSRLEKRILLRMRNQVR